MSARLHTYQRLERVMLELDAAGDPLADHLRDLMDPLWYALSDEEHALLDGRSPAPSSVVIPPSPAVRTELHVQLPSPLVPLRRAA
jgi:hypothetical protein